MKLDFCVRKRDHAYRGKEIKTGCLNWNRGVQLHACRLSVRRRIRKAGFLIRGRERWRVGTSIAGVIVDLRGKRFDLVGVLANCGWRHYAGCVVYSLHSIRYQR